MSENPRSSVVYVPTKPTCYRTVTATFIWCCFVKSITIDPIVAAGPLKQQHVFTPMSFRTVGWSTLIFLSYDLFLTLLPLHTFGHVTEAPSQNSAETRCRGFLVLESRCRGFSALESRCRGFLSSEKMSWNHDVVG